MAESDKLIYHKEAGVVTDRGNFIYTFSGIRFYPTDPRGNEMVIEDIAHALANSCRFTGHTKKFYSVAEHCCRMSREASSRERAYEALMHDCSEAWLVDIPRPLKAVPQFGARYKKMEEAIMEVAAKRFGFSWPMSPEVRELDEVLLNTEQRDLMPEAANLEGSWFPEVGVLTMPITPWAPTKAERQFLKYYGLLSK